MMRQYELVERVQRYNKNVDEALLNKAYVYGMAKHGHQQRASGDPYFSHPLEVAAILTDMRLDDATIAVGLLHDTIEDTDATRVEIDKFFGSEIGQLVEGLTKIERLDLMSKKVAQAENLRKLLLAISNDVRVLIVKLADRLHNMRTLHFVPDHKKRRIAEETRDIYAPLAGRMGMREMREELEELSFEVLNKNAYDAIQERLKGLRQTNQTHIEAVVEDIKKLLENAGIKAEVHGREKRPFSIFMKMERKKIGFEQLSDIYGFRVLVDDVGSCYQALGAIHQKWSTVPGRFKDYISTPKQNDYRSLHTTVIGPVRQRVELQIRTFEMHEIDEYGVAAHTLYKDVSSEENNSGSGLPQLLQKDSFAYAWLQNTVSHLAAKSDDDDDETSLDFIENTKLELFQDQVFCFTPKGRLIALPRGANSIDFAYAVHTDVGDSCVGSKINGQIMPLVTELQNGDEVEIIRSPAQRPMPVWENLVATGKARAAIRRAKKEEKRRQNEALGEQILKRYFELAEKPYSEKLLRDSIKRLDCSSKDDLLAKVGRGEVLSEAVLEAIYPDLKNLDTKRSLKTAAPSGEGWFATENGSVKFRIPGLGERADVASLRKKLSNMTVRFAPNGGAVPGDRIVAIWEENVGVTIYPIQSLSLSKFDDKPELWLDVRWDIDENEHKRFPARIDVGILNEPGSLALITQVIASRNSNIERLEMKHGANDFVDVEIDLEVHDLKILNQIISELGQSALVSNVVRVND